MTKISVITVSYNSQNTIERTIQSVQNQSFKDFEYIFVDGNSKDDTLKIAGSYKDFISKWISEPDKSAYDAMNKGVLLAQGDYILFLNSNDILSDNNTLKEIVSYINDEDILYFNAKIDNKNVKFNYKKRYNLYNTIAPISAKLYKREFLESLGGFDTRFKILSGYEFDLRAILKNNAKTEYINLLTSITQKNTEKTLSPKYMRRYTKENKVLKKSYFSPIERILYGVFTIF